MKEINDILPPLPKHFNWAALTNVFPTNAKLKMMNKILPHDRKWHLILEDQDQVYVDGKTIRRKSAESMT